MNLVTFIPFLRLIHFTGAVTERIEPSRLELRSSYPYPVVFKCYSSTLPLWKFSGGPIPGKHQIFYNGSIKVGMLTIPTLSHDHGGIYTCSGTTETNMPFTAKSVLAVLSYKSEMHPQYIKIQLGQFQVIEIRCFSNTTPRWSYMGESIPKKIRKFHPVGRLFHTLEIYAPKTRNSGWYYCRGTTFIGGKHFLDRSRLEVVDYNVHVNPTYKRVYQGSEETVTFECLSATRVNWTFNGGPMPKNIKQLTQNKSKHILQITRPQISNNGYYSCRGNQLKDNSPSSSPFVDKIKLEVLKIKGNVMPRYQRVIEFTSKSYITCLSSTQVVWGYKNRDLPATAKTIWTGTNIHVLEISSVQLNVSAGLYSCLGVSVETGELFQESSLLRVVIKQFDEVVHPRFMRFHMKQQETIEFTCTSQMYQLLPRSVTWKFNGGELPNNAEVFIVNNYHILRISQPIRSNSGVYKCTIKSGNRLIQDDAMLMVLHEQYDRLQPKYVRVYVSGTVIFKCTSGTPVKWGFVGTDGSTAIITTFKYNSSTHIVRRSPVTYSDEGLYSCKGIDRKSGKLFQEFSELEIIQP